MLLSVDDLNLVIQLAGDIAVVSICHVWYTIVVIVAHILYIIVGDCILFTEWHVKRNIGS